MEKLKSTHNLSDVKEKIKKDEIIPNLRVIESANKLGFSETEVYDEILKLTNANFYKSVTEIHNHKIWQDVYKKKIKNIPIYIKFQIVDEKLLLRSFKKDEGA